MKTRGFHWDRLLSAADSCGWSHPFRIDRNTKLQLQVHENEVVIFFFPVQGHGHPELYPQTPWVSGPDEEPLGGILYSVLSGTVVFKLFQN